MAQYRRCLLAWAALMIQEAWRHHVFAKKLRQLKALKSAEAPPAAVGRREEKPGMKRTLSWTRRSRRAPSSSPSYRRARRSTFGCSPRPPATASHHRSICCGRATTPGGSAANVLKGLAGISRAGRGEDEEDEESLVLTFVGTIEDEDAVGEAYEEALSRAGVRSALARRRRATPPLGSARCVCLVDEHGQRTMRTYLGAAAKTTVDDLPMGTLERADALHAEGYALYKPEVLRAACVAAKRNGALVSLDLASFEVVRNRREALEEILRSGMIDLVFCNEDEARELARGTSSEARPPTNGRAAERPSEEVETEALKHLLRFVRVATCSRGKRGCVSMNAAGERAESRAEGVTAIDTTGAGDTFTSGFLHAYLAGGSLRQCGDAGCAAGAEIVQVRGAEMDETRWRRVAEKIERILRRDA